MPVIETAADVLAAAWILIATGGALTGLLLLGGMLLRRRRRATGRWLWPLALAVGCTWLHPFTQVVLDARADEALRARAAHFEGQPVERLLAALGPPQGREAPFLVYRQRPWYVPLDIVAAEVRVVVLDERVHLALIDD